MLLYTLPHPPWASIHPLGSHRKRFGAKGLVVGVIFVSSWPSPWKAKASKSSESPTTSLLHPQAPILHAISARTILILYNSHRVHVLVWPLYPVSFLSGGRSNKGAMWCRHQTRDFVKRLLDELQRDAADPQSNALIMHTWLQQRRLSATEVAHGPQNNIRTNFGWVVWWGCYWLWGTFCGASTHRRPAIAHQSLPAIFRKASGWSECVRWPGRYCTPGEHGRDGTSETVEKFRSDANDLFKSQKGKRKSPAASQRCKRLLRGYGAPQFWLLSMDSTSATHLVAPFVERNGFRFMKKFDAIFSFSSSTTVFYPQKLNFRAN